MTVEIREVIIMGLNKLIIVLCSFVLYTEAAEIAPFVVNGTDATIEEFPFLVNYCKFESSWMWYESDNIHSGFFKI